MFWKFSTVRNSHSKAFYFKCFGIRIISYQENTSVTTIRPLFKSANTVVNCFKSYKYLQCLLRKSKINDFDILRRSLSTSSRCFNEKKESENPKEPNRNDFLQTLTIFLFIILLYMVLLRPSTSNASRAFISWEEFKQELLAKGEVKKIVINVGAEVVLAVLHEGAVFKNKQVNFVFMRVPEIKAFEEKLRETEKHLGISPQGNIPVEYVGHEPLHWGYWGGDPNLQDNEFAKTSAEKVLWQEQVINPKNPLSSRQRGTPSREPKDPQILLFRNHYKASQALVGKINVNKAKFTLVDPLTGKGKGVKFSDVAGLKEAKIEIMDFVDYLKRPEVYRNLGAKVPKGALLLGPPGCGKTLLAKAVATEASVPFLSMNGSEFIEIIGGLGAARVRDLFKEAKKRIPCIIYIDEIDAIGKKREGQNRSAGIGEEEQTLNQLLVEMDGMVSNEGVVLLASTNRADVLDAALLRPGRFDRHILIDFPTAEERQQIFEQHLKSIHLEHKPEVYSKRMAHLTPGFSGADIANVCNEAALHAARLKKGIVQGDDLEYAVERVVGGTEKRSSAMSAEEKKMFAYYEAGRALVGWMSKYGEALLKITIVSRTDSPAGWTQFSQGEKFLYSKEDLMGKMCMGLGGRVAVTLLFNRVTTAGEKDLKKVTRLAYAQIRRFGMNENIGLMSFDVEGGSNFKKPYSKALGNLFDQEARKIINAAYKETEQILIEHKDKLIKLAEELMKKETLNYEDVVELIGPPPFKGKKFLEPLEFALSLDQAVGPEPEAAPPPEQSKQESDENNL